MVALLPVEPKSATTPVGFIIADGLNDILHTKTVVRVVYNYAVIIADMDYLHSAVDAHMRKRLAHFFQRYAHLAQERDGRKEHCRR